MPKLKFVVFALLLGLILICGVGRATAGDLAKPQGKIILTVSGAISNVNGPHEATFDMALLKTLPKSKITTKTIWTDGTSTYEGVRLKDLLAAVGATGKNLHAIALNDYAVDVPVSDATAGGPILAYSVDGADLPVRSRGPLWLIYPFDDDAKYRTEVIYTRSIWQLNRIDVKD